MQRAKIVKEELKEGGKLFLSLHLETRNANLLFLSEDSDSLGTLAVAIPQTQKMLGPPLSSILLGERYTITARLLAEQLAKRTEKIALVSVFAKTLTEKEAGTAFLQLFRKTLEKGSREE
ncbi:MAG: proteasome assembly chaperone 4 family protein [Candidatus Bathyarchaeota archaeon]|nr:proteasome assembly chaperone 4 family protein [Candidatus Bathyarchaeota archaeon]